MSLGYSRARVCAGTLEIMLIGKQSPPAAPTQGPRTFPICAPHGSKAQTLQHYLVMLPWLAKKVDVGSR